MLLSHPSSIERRDTLMDEETIRAGAEATKEVAITGRIIMESAGKLARYFDGMLRERAGIAEDNMKFRRFENRVRLFDKAERILEQRGIDGPTRDVPPKFALPLITYATLEEDEELQDIWANLLANAADGGTPIELRTTYIDVLKDLTASDVKILSMLAKLSISDLPQEFPPGLVTSELPRNAKIQTTLDGKLEQPSDQAKLSLSNLNRSGCIVPTVGFGGMPNLALVYVTPLGTALYRACSK
jgi:hypothetical protein